MKIDRKLFSLESPLYDKSQKGLYSWQQNRVFPKCFHHIQQIQWHKYMSLKGLEPATFCVTDQDASTAPARYV